MAGIISFVVFLLFFGSEILGLPRAIQFVADVLVLACIECCMIIIKSLSGVDIDTLLLLMWLVLISLVRGLCFFDRANMGLSRHQTDVTY
jgi:hypothetical protein